MRVSKASYELSWKVKSDHNYKKEKKRKIENDEDMLVGSVGGLLYSTW